MKIQKISEHQHTFCFLFSTDNLNAYYARFLESYVGKIHFAIPWESIVDALGIKEKATGSKMLFCPKGRIALASGMNSSIFSETKDTLSMLAQVAANELTGRKIRVNLVSSGLKVLI